MAELLPRVAPCGPPPVRIIPAFQLLRDFKPPESIIDGLPAPRRAVVSITAPTGHAKTTLASLMAMSLVRGLRFAGRDVTQGSVLMCMGENADDGTMHLAATAQDLGLSPADLSRAKPMGELLIVPMAFDVEYEFEALRARLVDGGTEFVAVFVDTSAA